MDCCDAHRSVRLRNGLDAIEDIIAKTVGVSEIAQIARIEGRLFQLYTTTWTTLAGEAVAAAGAKADGGGNAAQVAQAVNRVMRGWAPRVQRAFPEDVQRIYRLARIAGWKKATGQIKGSLAYGAPSHVTPDVGKSLRVQKAPRVSGPVWDLVDEQASEALVTHQVFWTGKHYADHVSGSIATTAREAIVEAGQSRRRAGEVVQEAVRQALGKVVVPDGYRGSAEGYFEGLAANAATVGRAHGQLRSFGEADITHYTIVNPLDRSTCLACAHLEGKVFTIEHGRRIMDAELEAKDPAKVKEIHPWLKIDQIREISPKPGRGDGEAALAARGVAIPPFHYKCRCGIDMD